MNAHEDSNADSSLAVPTYDPGHPWHYLKCGDGAAPVQADQIPMADIEIAGGHLERELPKTPAKRDAAVERLFGERSAELAERIARYQSVIARGADALSSYDREFAYRNDELAVASTLGLLYGQISYLRAELAWLDTRRSGQGSLF